MKKLFRLLFVAAMFLSGCNGNGGTKSNVPDGYKLENSWPTEVISEFFGEQKITIPDAGVTPVLYCVYDDPVDSIDLMIAGDHESEYVSILRNANWIIGEERSATAGYECHDTSKIAEVDVQYVSKYGYTYIDIYKYYEVNPNDDPFADYTNSTIWPATQIDEFLEQDALIPALTDLNLYQYKIIADGEDEYFRVAVEDDLRLSYGAALTFSGFVLGEETNYFVSSDGYVGVRLSLLKNHTCIDFYNLDGKDVPSTGNWPTSVINSFLGTAGVVPQATDKQVSYEQYDAEGQYCAYIEIIASEDLEDAYKATLETAGWEIDDTQYDTYGYCAIDPNEICEVDFFLYEECTYFYVYRYEDIYGGGGESYWPTEVIDEFLGSTGIVPAATEGTVEYAQYDEDGEYSAYIEIVAEGDLENSYISTLEEENWEIDDTYYDTYGYCAVDPDEICEVDFFAYDGYTYFYVYRYDDLYGGGGDTSNYGTLSNPLSVTEALAVAASECTENYDVTAEPIYCYGEVTSFETSTKSYKNVYITDGTSTVLIYTLDFYDGYEMAEGDVIEIYGYMKNYQGVLQFATNKSGSTSIYVEIVDYENGGGEEDYECGPWPTALINEFLGDELNVPAPTTGDVYYLEHEATEDYAACIEIYYEGSAEDAYKATLETAGWEIDDTYYDDYGYCAVDPDQIAEVDFFDDEGYACFYIYRYEDLYGGGGDTSNYGTLSNPLSVTEALAVAGEECTTSNSYTAEPIYCYGEVQMFTDMGTYYKNVYISDGENEVLIYTLDMLDGYSMLAGDFIEIYGYMKNYNGTLEFASYGSTTVTIVDYEDGEEDYEYGPWPTSLIEDLVGGSDIVPAATTDDVYYYFYEAAEAHSAFVEIICDGNLEDSYVALLEEANWTIDDSYYDLYGYFAYDANQKAYIQFFFYEDETCFFIYNYDDVVGGSGEYVTEWPGDAIVEFLGSEATTVPSFEAEEYYVEEYEADETYAACLMICCEEDVSSAYFNTIKDLDWAYWTSQEEGYTAEDPEHTVFLNFGYSEDYGFCLYIYRWADVKEESGTTSAYGTITNELVTTGDQLNVKAFGITKGTSYSDYTATVNQHTYDLHAYATADYLQIRSKSSDSGLVLTTSTGYVAGVSIDWNSASAKSNNTYASVEIYASNTPFAIEDMYSESENIVKVATLTCQSSCTFTFNADSNYQYIGIRSYDGATYINNIYVQFK